MDGETWKVAIERAASLLADDNRVEDAWFLRGVADGLARCSRDTPLEYRRDYDRGYDAGWREGE